MKISLFISSFIIEIHSQQLVSWCLEKIKLIVYALNKQIISKGEITNEEAQW